MLSVAVVLRGNLEQTLSRRNTRVLGTVLGAALAWGFSYVLPWWERRSLPRAIARVLTELCGYASHVLDAEPGAAVEQRRAYDTLSALAAAVQRSAVEPKAECVPVHELAALIDHGQRLMAHLSMLRLILLRNNPALAGEAGAAALRQASAAMAACLNLSGSAPPMAEDIDPEASLMLPAQAPADDALPWFVRRLQVLAHAAQQVRVAALGAL